MRVNVTRTTQHREVPGVIWFAAVVQRRDVMHFEPARTPTSPATPICGHQRLFAGLRPAWGAEVGVVTTHASTVEPMSVQNEHTTYPKRSKQLCRLCKKNEISDLTPPTPAALCKDCAKSIAKQIEPLVLKALNEQLY